MKTSTGIFETKGFAAALAGAEKILENNEIELVKIEKTGEGIVSLFFKGGNEKLKSAFEVGIIHSRSIGEIVAVYIMQETNKQIEKLLLQKNSTIEAIPIQGKVEEKPIKELDTPKSKKIIVETPTVTDKAKSTKLLTSSSTIQRLRREALSSQASNKKKIAKPNSPEGMLLGQINISKLESMNVHELRRLARNTNGFPIQGREISKANRKELIIYFKESI